MSDLLDSRLTPEQLQECEKNDALMGIKTAHGITRTGPANVSGVHLSDAANEPGSLEFSEDELIAADLAYLANREARDRQRITLLHEQELNKLRERGGL